MDNIEEQWKMFASTNYDLNSINCSQEVFNNTDNNIPTCTPLNISTKSKIIYLNSTFDLYDLFWKLKIIDYDNEEEGIIKKQMKFNFIDKSQVLDFEDKIKQENVVNIKILNQINNPSGRVTFKDVRKVDIGISNKDIIKTKKKVKALFITVLLLFLENFMKKLIENSILKCLIVEK